MISYKGASKLFASRLTNNPCKPSSLFSMSIEDHGAPSVVIQKEPGSFSTGYIPLIACLPIDLSVVVARSEVRSPRASIIKVP